MAEEGERHRNRSQRRRGAGYSADAWPRRHQGLRRRRGLVRIEVRRAKGAAPAGEGQMRATMALRTATAFIVITAMIFGWINAASAEDAPAPGLIAIPADHDSELKFYAADGSVVTGSEALTRMREANLTLWVASNQFFAMDKVIGDCQRNSPGSTVGLITLPPGLILSASLGGDGVTADRPTERPLTSTPPSTPTISRSSRPQV